MNRRRRFGPAAGMMDLVAGYAATSLLYSLHQSGVLESLEDWHTADELASLHRFDSRATATVMTFLAQSTDVLVKRGGRYRLSRRNSGRPFWRMLLEKFAGAYAPVLNAATSCLRDLDAAGQRIDQDALERAYRWDRESPEVVRAILQLKPTGVLDLGCGRGVLLSAVCADRAVCGWGIDRSSSMCRASRSTLAAAGLSRRVSIRCGDALAAGKLMSPEERRRVTVVHAGSLFNEFAQEEAIIVAVLARLTRLFRGRWLICVDYLGVLPGHTTSVQPYTHSYTCLTDLAQALTGQGVPPKDHRRWAQLYQAAGARLVRVIEGNTLDLRWFVHVVRLGGKRSEGIYQRFSS